MKKTVCVLTAAVILLFLFSSAAFAAAPVFGDYESAGKYLAENMENYAGTVEFDFVADVPGDLSAFGGEMFENVFEAAFTHNGIPTRGDYLRYTYDEVLRSASIGITDGQAVYDCAFTYTYMITAAQEKELSVKIGSVLSGIMPPCRNEYEKVRAIHDYIVNAVEYDHSVYAGAANKLKYTAYAAAVNGKSVCEGYSLLFYRMCLAAGTDCRIISGTANGGAHSWNIVKLGDKWYNIDCTWDDTARTEEYFLRGSGNFPRHESQSDYITDGYAVSETDFDLSSCVTRQKHISGDADGDGLVNINDARSALRIAIGLDYAAQYSFVYEACDCDANGDVTVADARTILRRAIGLE